MMTYRKYAALIVLFSVVTLFTGCGSKCPPTPEPIVKIVYKTKEVKVEVPCKLPEIDCDFVGEGFVPTEKLLQCVVTQKRALETCSGITKKK